MIHEFRPATPEEAVEHFGRKGMHWGVRKSDEGVSGPPKQGMSKKKKVTIGVGAVVILGVGAVAVNAVLKKRGMEPIVSLAGPKALPFKYRRGREPISTVIKAKPEIPFGGKKPKIPYSWDTRAAGGKAAARLEKKVWDTPAQQLSNMIKDAHAEQNVYMKKAFKEMGGQYIPRTNPYSPEARTRKALGL